MELRALWHSVQSRDMKLSVTQKRTSFHSSFSLTDLKESDCGVYTVWDTENDEIISTYTVTLTGKTLFCVWILSSYSHGKRNDTFLQLVYGLFLGA